MLARGVADAGLLSAFGASLFRAWLAPASWRVATGSMLGALVALGLWAAVVGADLGGSVAAVPDVLRSTVFGRVLLLQAGLLLVALVLRRWAWLAAGLAGLALAGQAGHGHALAMSEGPSWLLLSVGVHLLAAGAWLGGLVPLWAMLRAGGPGVAAAVGRFGNLGMVCVPVMAGTALLQSSALMGPVAGWAGFDYGRAGLLKLVLFGVLLVFAAANRFRLARSESWLAWSVAGETAVGLGVVLAAGFLASSAPAMDM